MSIEDPLFQRLYEEIERLPVIDCHEHVLGPGKCTLKREPISHIIQGYLQSDLLAAGLSDRELEILNNDEIPTEDKWELFRLIWEKTKYTAYAMVTRLEIKSSYGDEEMSLDVLSKIRDDISTLDEKRYYKLLDEANIKLMLSDILDIERLSAFIEDRFIPSERIKLLFSLPGFHHNARDFNFVQSVGAILNRAVYSLDDYLEVIYELLRRAKEKGIIGIKDQSAYTRAISYDMVPEYEAERLFNRILSDPRESLGWPEVKPLDDYLFHQFMRFAKELELPVQIHTGHMAGIRNRIEKTNAIQLSNILELYREVNFDLFHGNWPYMGEFLFLGKNYPNVYLDFCWVNIIDPLYSEELYTRALLTVPHTKINGFGG
ncbi:MAG: amidohydrolase family protein, partial [bacterium]